MSDSIGLYVGNPVTQMGYKIGSVDTIEPKGKAVEVGFTLSKERRIPQDVKAVIRSPSILADRSLELVGNYGSGPQLAPHNCIPLDHTSTPLSISQIIGSANDFINGINPADSTNIKDALRGIDATARGNGPGVNKLLTTSSALLDSPDQAINDIGALTRNMAQLTSMLKDNRTPLKEILQDMAVTGADVTKGAAGADKVAYPLPELFQAANDIEIRLGPQLQLLLDSVADTVRILSPHYKGIANMLNPLARYVGGLSGEPPGTPAGALAKRLNNHIFNLLPLRPPLFRIRTPNGLLSCGIMNSKMPGSCADIAGMPYAVDVALLQYVLMEAHNQ